MVLDSAIVCWSRAGEVRYLPNGRQTGSNRNETLKFRRTMAESAIERLRDMLRYTLKEDGRELVEFSKEYDFTRQRSNNFAVRTA